MPTHFTRLRGGRHKKMQNTLPRKRQGSRIPSREQSDFLPPAHPSTPQQMEPSLSVGDFPPPPLRLSSTPTHSPPPRPVRFCWLRYKVDFLVRSFIFSWERFWRPRKKRLPPPPSRSILHLLRGLLGTASRHRPQPWVAKAARVALPPTKFGLCERPSPAGAEVAGKG